MPALYKFLLITHVAVGFMSLVLFWIPVAVRKGGASHRRVGRWYANAMYIVAGSAFAITVMVLADPLGVKHPGAAFDVAESAAVAQRERMLSLFLLAISVLVFTSIRQGILTLRAKRDHALMRQPLHLALNGALGLLGIGLGVVGAIQQHVLFGVFAFICVSAAVGNLRYCLARSPGRNEWMVAHMSAMFGGGIGTHTAFFVFGGQQFLAGIFSGYWSLIPWVAPAVIGGLATRAMAQRYRARGRAGA